MRGRADSLWRVRRGHPAYDALVTATVGAAPDERGEVVVRQLVRAMPVLADAVWARLEGQDVVIGLRPAAPDAARRALGRLLGEEVVAEPVSVLDVDPAEFAVEAPKPIVRIEEDEEEILRSTVRYFPYPECQWFETGTGDLVLTEERVRFEPYWELPRDSGSGPYGEHDIPLESIGDWYRGEWWDVPCLMLGTAERIYRYGWPAERGEVDKVFEVDEWLVMLTSVVRRRR